MSHDSSAGRPPATGGASNRGRHYTQEEIDKLYLEAQKPDARQKENLEILAKQHGRSPDAIDFVLRWCQRADFPPKADNLIKRQVRIARKKFSKEQQT
jgi:hypothetical protein